MESWTVIDRLCIAAKIINYGCSVRGQPSAYVWSPINYGRSMTGQPSAYVWSPINYGRSMTGQPLVRTVAYISTHIYQGGLRAENILVKYLPANNSM